MALQVDPGELAGKSAKDRFRGAASRHLPFVFVYVTLRLDSASPGRPLDISGQKIAFYGQLHRSGLAGSVKRLLFQRHSAFMTHSAILQERTHQTRCRSVSGVEDGSR
jgi:hypothetical protein